jgi:RNase H-fold protein (predicted Holliday junction resolvase)
MPDPITSLRTALTNLERSEPEPALTALLAAAAKKRGASLVVLGKPVKGR